MRLHRNTGKTSRPVSGRPLAAQIAVGAVALLTLTLFLFTTWTNTTQASSLWSETDSLYRDTKARRVGDLVTMIIVERSQATQSASTQTGSDGKVQVGPIALADIVPVIPPISAGGSDSASAKGSTTRGGSLNARMTAQVVELLPNGNLVIEGRQTIIVNGEEQIIIVSGQVRPQDIAPDNTVLSTFVADATIAYHGTGPVGDKQTPGLLTRIFNWLF